MTAVSTVSHYPFRNLPPEEIDKQDPILINIVNCNFSISSELTMHHTSILTHFC